MRSLGGKPAISERLTLPAALFEGLDETAIPNNLYGSYARHYRVIVANGREKLKAVALGAEDAAILGVAAGCPALLIDRLAYGLDGAAVEWRRSYCLTEHVHYFSELR
jgi:GntR family transcriptional regulator